MGTRSLVVFENSDGDEICVVYRQYDGYPSARGRELVDFLDNRRLVNGFGDTEIKQSNGIEDCVAQWIAWEKINRVDNPTWHIGNVYIHPPYTRDIGEQYIYTIREDREGFSLTCWDVYNEEFTDKDMYEDF